jgi:putative toxin-antitoxin system antitoxin component (TIGR02293 family)
MTVAAIAEVLGGSKAIKADVRTAADLVELTRQGIPAGVLPAMVKELSMDRKMVARVVGIPERTWIRRTSSGSRLTPAESDRTIRFARILALAVDTLGDQAKASRWLQTENRALEGRTPFELLDTDAGVQTVETVLGRIAYGIYS